MHYLAASVEGAKEPEVPNEWNACPQETSCTGIFDAMTAPWFWPRGCWDQQLPQLGVGGETIWFNGGFDFTPNHKEEFIYRHAILCL